MPLAKKNCDGEKVKKEETGKERERKHISNGYNRKNLFRHLHWFYCLYLYWNPDTATLVKNAWNENKRGRNVANIISVSALEYNLLYV